jgi:beta-lactamase class D
MADLPFDEIVELALQLSPGEQARLMERLAASVREVLDESGEKVTDDEPLTDEEIAEMLKVEPMTGTEIVAAGLTGGWADMGITDGAEWVNEQKRKRKEKI